MKKLLLAIVGLFVVITASYYIYDIGNDFQQLTNKVKPQLDYQAYTPEKKR